jgi:hypothetical protein
MTDISENFQPCYETTKIVSVFPEYREKMNNFLRVYFCWYQLHVSDDFLIFR